MNKYKYPDESTFPSMLTFKAVDADDNERDVTYVRADEQVNITGRFVDFMTGDFKGAPKLDFTKEKDHE